MNTTKSESVRIAPKVGQRGMSKFVYTAFMFLLLMGICAGVLALFFKTLSITPLALGIVAMLIYSIICFTVKKGSRGWLTWWGILSLAMAVWWTILLIRSQM